MDDFPTQIIHAFNPNYLVGSVYIDLSPWLLGVAGVIIAVSLIKWGVKRVKNIGDWSSDVSRRDRIAREKGFKNYKDYEENI